ncbi:TPA: hypothetical protein J5G01_001527 [Escherichia coli]|uniref:hypothetical protein n=1 Tax=Escherichia coli TaxID=562 RepID=UPI00165A0BEF|nr:hypothetical protein [Escherichia coli]MBC9154719.1 hypothetical protein [Escherichia coli]HBB3785700.1 hypothetical protein [Escherichia coli]
MSTITREWLQQAINDYESVRDELPFGLDDYQGNILAALRIALASLEAEPIGFRCRRNDNLGDWSYVYHREPDDFERKHLVIEGIYAAPPAPVSVPAAMEIDDDFDSAFEHGKAVGWNAYRAAMLQAEPVSNSDELPLDYLQGHKDGLEWAAQLAEANHPQTGDWLYDDQIDLARAIRKGPDMPTVQGGNSPVIPDDVRRMDWLVSKTVDVREPMVYGSHSLFWSQTITDEEDDYHATKLREQIDAAMAAEQAAAPQQEAE